VLAVAGLLPLLVALAFAGKVVLMLSHDRDGRGGFAEGDYSAATGEFSANDTLNWFEPWVSAFDEGAARHADGDLEGALARYTEALKDVPERDECTVRINAALAHETLGDAALEGGDPDEAQAQWQAGIDTLAKGGCPTDSGRGRQQTDDAAAVDKRLRDKLQQQGQSDKPDKPDKGDPQDGQQQDDQQGGLSPEEKQQQREEQRREKRLEQRNDDAIEEQQDYQDDNQERDYSQYHW
jgi:hypothetical protein